jgi:hypothetical protein
MPYQIKRILLKSGELITEHEPDRSIVVIDGPAPVVGDIVTADFRGRRFSAKVIWGNWQGRDHSADEIVPLRVEEI